MLFRREEMEGKGIGCDGRLAELRAPVFGSLGSFERRPEYITHGVLREDLGEMVRKSAI
jgi:hypothetical protein